jgi:hypothetical protein
MGPCEAATTSGSAKIRIGQIFKVEISRSAEPAGDSFTSLTTGSSSVGADQQKGIFFYKEVEEPGQPFRRLPAFIFYTNPFKVGSEQTPGLILSNQTLVMHSSTATIEVATEGHWNQEATHGLAKHFISTVTRS